MSKFASITAGLLARKGEARPWAHAQAQSLETETVAELRRSFAPAVHGPRDIAPLKTVESSGPPAALEGSRKLTLRLSEADYECLGLIAAKRDVTRQTLVREILDRFLAEAAEEHRGRCGCIGSGCRR